MKLLMLHGYTQNGDAFKRKLRRLTDRLDQAFPGITYEWPDGPLQLNPSDIPIEGDRTRYADCAGGLGLRAWFSLRYAQDPPEGLMQSLDLVAEVLKRKGPFDGMIAFSQGTVIASTVAALLQGRIRHRAFEEADRRSAKVMPYPKSFLDVSHPPLKFAVLYAARVGRGSFYDWWYEPSIATPFCHFIGLNDPKVDHAEREAVLRKLSSHRRSSLAVHGGAHFVPTDRRNSDMAAEFIASAVSSKECIQASSVCQQSEEWDFVEALAECFSRGPKVLMG